MRWLRDRSGADERFRAVSSTGGAIKAADYTIASRAQQQYREFILTSSRGRRLLSVIDGFVCASRYFLVIEVRLMSKEGHILPFIPALCGKLPLVRHLYDSRQLGRERTRYLQRRR